MFTKFNEKQNEAYDSLSSDQNAMYSGRQCVMSMRIVGGVTVNVAFAY